MAFGVDVADVDGASVVLPDCASTRTQRSGARIAKIIGTAAIVRSSPLRPSQPHSQRHLRPSRLSNSKSWEGGPFASDQPIGTIVPGRSFWSSSIMRTWMPASWGA